MKISKANKIYLEEQKKKYFGPKNALFHNIFNRCFIETSTLVTHHKTEIVKKTH
jgi:hypothetical protein